MGGSEKWYKRGGGFIGCLSIEGGVQTCTLCYISKQINFTC